MVAQTIDHIATEGPKYGVYLKESKLKAYMYMPMMCFGLPHNALEQDALDYAKGRLMIADRGYEVSPDGLERVLAAPVTVDTQFADDALSKRMQEYTSLGALIHSEQLEFPQKSGLLDNGLKNWLMDSRFMSPKMRCGPRCVCKGACEDTF